MGNANTNQNQSKSLYDRLGGIYSIAAVVNDFSDRLISNPKVGINSPNPQLQNWSRNQLDRLPGLKWMRTLWVANVSGGPYKFVPTKPGRCPLSLENAHFDLKISPDEFDAVANELFNALRDFNVPETETQEVLTAFAKHKPDVTLGYNMIQPNNPNLSKIMC